MVSHRAAPLPCIPALTLLGPQSTAGDPDASRTRVQAGGDFNDRDLRIHCEGDPRYV